MVNKRMRIEKWLYFVSWEGNVIKVKESYKREQEEKEKDQI